MDTIVEYDEVAVTKDINPRIHEGMVGLVVTKERDEAEVIFTNDTGKTHCFDGKSSFWISTQYLQRV